MPPPTIRTRRPLLRPFGLDDAPEVRRLAGARETAATTLRIPRPYGAGIAEDRIGSQAAAFGRDEEVVFAIVAAGRLRGSIGLVLAPADRRARR